jgi:hypothetical protein
MFRSNKEWEPRKMSIAKNRRIHANALSIVKPGRLALAIGVMFAAASSVALADPVTAFSDNFENGLGAWTDRTPGNPQSIIALDPLNSSNHVLAFVQLGSAGSIFTTNSIVSSGLFTVSFDFLGRPIAPGVPTGGFFGISNSVFQGGFAGPHQWVAGDPSYPVPIHLVSDNTWHSYSLTFSSQIGQTVHLMFEDFGGADGAANAYFDNIRFNDSSVAPAPLTPVPEPETYAMMLAGLGLLGLTARRRKQKAA